MHQLEVKSYTNSYFDLWNQFVENSKNGTFLFHRNFMEYHSDRFEDASILVFRNEKLVALFPANKSNNAIYSHQGLTYGGVILPKKVRFETIKNIFDSIVEFYKQRNVTKLIYKEIPSIYCSKFNDDIKYLLWNNGAKVSRMDTLSVIDLNHPILLNKGRIEGVKRGRKNNLEVKEVENFDAFWNEILIPNLSAKHEAQPVHSLAEITYLKSKFPKKIRQFNVYKAGKIVAGTTVFETDLVAHSQYISSNAEKNTLGSLDFLHHYLLTEVFNEKSYFDFGISNENQGESVNYGLNFWKQSFGAATYAQLFFELDLQQLNQLKPIFL